MKKIEIIIKSVLLTILFYLASNIFALLILVALFFELNSQPEIWAISLGKFFGAIFFLFFIYWFIFKTLKLEKQVIKLSLYYLLPIILGFVFVLLINFLEYTVDTIFSTRFYYGGLNRHENLEVSQIPNLLAVVVIFPVIEELFFRKYLITKLRTEFNWAFSIFISSILFTLVHLPSINKCFITIFGGLIAGYLYYRTGKMIFPILFHISWNFLVHYSKYCYVPFLS